MSKNNFFSRLVRPAVIPCPCGSSEADVYQELSDSDGKRYLKKVGVENTFDFIQASKDECDIYRILERFSNGDINALHRVQGKFVDSTVMPTTLAEVHNIINSATQQFFSLPKEVRDNFGSVDNYVSSVINDRSCDLMSKLVVNKTVPAAEKLESEGDNNNG